MALLLNKRFTGHSLSLTTTFPNIVFIRLSGTFEGAYGYLGEEHAMGRTRIPLIVSALLLLGAATSLAQPLTGPLNYDVKTLTFELWCQDTQRYPIERCNARRPADVTAFEAYRAAIERYELQYLKQADRERQIRDSVNRDPMQSAISRQDSGPGSPR